MKWVGTSLTIAGGAVGFEIYTLISDCVGGIADTPVFMLKDFHMVEE